MPSRRRWSNGRSDGVPANPARLARLGRPLQGHRRACAGAPASTPRWRSSPSSSRPRAPWTPRRTDDEGVEDDRLRLIFTCCHPALPPDAQVALTLREVCGLTTEEIARAFLTAPPTLAQRIVRAKAKIRDARIPYQVPSPAELPERLDTVLHVIYLVFNEGYSASSGESLTRPDLSGEAIRLGRLLVELLPEPEVMGLLALMLLHESRRAARTSPDGRAGPAGGPGPLAAGTASRSRRARRWWSGRWRRAGSARTRSRRRSRRCTPRRRTAAATDWAQIVGLYDVLARVEPSPVVELNRAVAVAMRDGPAAGLALIDAILARGDWPTTTWRTRPGPTCAGGSGGRRRPAPPTSARSPSRAQEPERRLPRAAAGRAAGVNGSSPDTTRRCRGCGS